MTSPPDPNNPARNPRSPKSNETKPSEAETAESDAAIDFDQQLREVEQSLLLLKVRYAQVQADQTRQQDLQQRKEQVERQLQASRSNSHQTELKAELKQIRQQLEDLEVSLESKLFSWSGLKEVFWQAVRFGGIGIVVGWILRSIAGG
jgi:cobalamin-dependent methionine synthase I